MEPVAKYLTEVEDTVKIKLYEVTCPKCQNSFTTQRWGKGKINAVPCTACNCLFNAVWE